MSSSVPFLSTHAGLVLLLAFDILRIVVGSALTFAAIGMVLLFNQRLWASDEGVPSGVLIATGAALWWQGWLAGAGVFAVGVLALMAYAWVSDLRTRQRQHAATST